MRSIQFVGDDSPDSFQTVDTFSSFRTWFYFAIHGVERGRQVHFHIKNMNFQRSLYAAGLKPFFRVGNEGKFKRIPGKLTWNVSLRNSNF